MAIQTKGGACITTEKLGKFLPSGVLRLEVQNVLVELAKILRKMYSFS